MTSKSPIERSDSLTVSVRPVPQVGLMSGRWTAHDDMRLPIGDLGFRQGATAVERLRTYGGKIFQLAAHLNRWKQSVQALGIEGLPLRTATEVLLDELIGRNETFTRSAGDYGITLFATPGSAGADIPTFAMHLNAIDHAFNAKRKTAGQRLVITGVAQPSPKCWPRSIKVRSRLHYYLADQIAADQLHGSLGVLVDPDGGVTDTSVANLAIVEAGRVVSPPVDRVLGGITQQVIRRLAAETDVSWTDATITADRLTAADEVLVMGTDGGLWFASHVDSHRIGDGKPGKLYGQLQARFTDFTGE